MSATMIETPIRLDDILELPEPEQTRAIRAWIEEGDQTIDDPYGGKVLIKTVDDKPVTIRHRGQEYKFTPAGKRLPRRVALDLLLAFGKNGYMRGRDQATGMTRAEWVALRPSEREIYQAAGIKEPQFIETYLTHIPDTPRSGDEED